MSRQAYVEVATYVDPESGDLKPADQAEVFVYEAGTTKLVSIYESRSGSTLLSNPFITGENGLVEFWTVSGDYDIKFHDTKAPTRFGDYTIGWQSSPVDTVIDAGELSSEGDLEWTQDPKTGAWIPQIKANAIGPNELAANSVETTGIKDGAVIESKLANGAGALKKLSTEVQRLIGSAKKKIIPEGQSVSNTSFTLMSTPDEIPAIFVPKDGILIVHYSAFWFSSVENAGRAAIFITSNQLKSYQPGSGQWKTQAACYTGGEEHRRLLTTSAPGLVSPSESKIIAAEEMPTSGVALSGGVGSAGVGWREEIGGVVVEHATDFPQGGLLIIEGLNEGEYSISVKFKSASGSVVANNRRLRAWTREPQ